MRNTFLVFKRDYLGYVQAWGFWLGILAAPVLLVLMALLLGLASNSTPDRYYAVIETGNLYAEQIDLEFKREQENLAEVTEAITGNAADVDDLEGFTGKFIAVAPPARTVDELRPYLLGEKTIDGPDGEKPLFAAIIVAPDGSGIEYWSEDVTVGDLRRKVRDASRQIARTQLFTANNIDPAIIAQADDAALDVLQRRIRSVEEQATAGNEVTTADRAPFFIAVGVSYVLWLMIFSVIQYLLMGTIEERSNKIFDSLLTSVRLPQLLAGKLGAVLAVTMTMMGSWVLFGVLAYMFGAQSIPPESAAQVSDAIGAGLSPSIVIPALISFVVGYLMYGVVFMALGSLCDTIQEAQTLISPMMILLMLPMVMIVIAANDPTSPIINYVSWIPLFTPFILILRMPTEPPMWEVLAQISLMIATTALVMWLATKVYRAGAVHGAGISDATKWLRGLIPGLKPKEEPTGEA